MAILKPDAYSASFAEFFGLQDILVDSLGSHNSFKVILPKPKLGNWAILTWANWMLGLGTINEWCVQ